MALNEESRALRIDAGCQQHRGEIQGPSTEISGLVLHGDRVEIDDAEERLTELLRAGVLAEPAAVVAKRRVTRRLDPREDPHRQRLAASAYPNRRRPPAATEAGSSRRHAWSGASVLRTPLES